MTTQRNHTQRHKQKRGKRANNGNNKQNKPHHTKTSNPIEIPNALLTNYHIPKPMAVLLSRGPKFGLKPNQTNLFSSGGFDKVISHLLTPEEGPNSPPTNNNLNKLQNLLTQTSKKHTQDNTNTNPTTKFWAIAEKTTSSFLKQHPNTFIMPGDKGNVTIIINKKEYDHKMSLFIKSGLEESTFVISNEQFIANRQNARIRSIIKNNTSTLKLRAKLLQRLTQLINNNHKPLDKAFINTRTKHIEIQNLKLAINKTNNLQTLVNKTLNQKDLLPRLYGSIKTHKQNNPIRPIVDTRNTIGGPVAAMLATLLNPYKNKQHNVLNSIDLVNRLQNTKLPPNKNTILPSLDVKDMFTNIPTRAATHHIVNKFGSDIHKVWNMKKDELSNILNFTLTDINYFQYNQITYKQTGGLAMGSPLAPIIADLYMDHLFEVNKHRVDGLNIITATKYVDDILIIGEKDSIEAYKLALENTAAIDKTKFEDHGKIELTLEYEDAYKSLSYLESTITRSPHNTLYTNWFKKQTASDRMLNFHSNHPKQMVRETATEYISTKIRLTSPLFLDWTITKLYRLLSNNDYPKWHIIKLMEIATSKTLRPDIATKLQKSITAITSNKPMRKLSQEERKMIYNKILTHRPEQTPTTMPSTQLTHYPDTPPLTPENSNNLHLPLTNITPAHPQNTYIQTTHKTNRKTSTKPNTKTWQCIPYLGNISDKIKTLVSKNKNSSNNKLNFYIPKTNRNLFYNNPKDKKHSLEKWHSIAIIPCSDCHTTFLIASTRGSNLKTDISKTTSPTKQHTSRLQHTLDIKKGKTKKIRPGYPILALLKVISNRHSTTQPGQSIISILNNKIVNNTANERPSTLNANIQKIHQILNKQETTTQTNHTGTPM
ncbi:unnamed protein product [Hermetia illucens]|uniref:Reverse transcriptase domain-containing protein n=1 Tax=Hermetia illucens TaxID=343691 RepID=A0A7R8YM88_HERIL|nr:unnamed protein product [Hermetia illucens]